MLVRSLTTSPSNVKFDKGETKTIEQHWYDMDRGG